MKRLCPVKHITNEEDNFAGDLQIHGDLQDNCILFRFVFDKPEMVQPLLIWLESGHIATGLLEKAEDYLGILNKKDVSVIACNIPDYFSPIMKAPLIYPDFPLREHRTEVIKIEGQISCHI
jgi:hypothetical protein